MIGHLGALGWVLALGFSIAVIVLSERWLDRTLATVACLIAAHALLRGRPGQWLARWLDRPLSSKAGAPTRSRVVTEVCCPVVVLTVVLGVFHRIFLGDAPLTADHPLHLFQGWVMSEHLLPSGRISGWVHLRGAGYPAGVLYPVGANLLLAGVRLVLPGSVSWETVYAVGFLVAMVACHLAVYVAGREVAGPWAGLFAGLFSVLDHGAYRQGGWSFAVQVGVWPVSLAMAAAVLGVVLLHRGLRGPSGPGSPDDPAPGRPRARLLALAALLVGASIFTHPMSLAFLALALPVVIGHAALEAERGSPFRVVVTGLLVSALALSVSAFWLVPFLAFREHSSTLGTGSMTMARQAEGVVLLTFFERMWCVPAALALVGGISVWRHRAPTGRLLTLLFAFIALAINGTTLVNLEVDRWFSRISNLQPDRFYVYLRPMAYLLAGAGCLWVVRQAGEAVSRRVGALRRWTLRVLACVAFGTFLVPVGEAVFWDVVSPRGLWTGTPDGYARYREVAERIGRHARESADQHHGFVRTTWPTACPGWAGGGRHCFESSPVYTGLGHVHPSYHAAAGYTGLFGFTGESSTVLLRSLGVRYRVTTRPRPGERALFQQGGLWVYQLEDAAEGPFTVHGQATARLESFEDERVEISVSGAGRGDHLTLTIPYFPDWHAYLDGREVPIGRTSVEGIESAMTVPLVDGTLELRYERSASEVAGVLLTALALLICLLLVVGRWPLPRRWRDRVAGVAQRIEAQVQLRRRWLIAGCAALVVLLAAGAAAGLWRQILEDRPRFDTVVDFEDARVWVLSGGTRRACRPMWSEAWRCGPGAHELVTPTYTWTSMGNTHGAIFAHPLHDAELHIDFPRVALGTGLAGGLGVAHSGGGRARVSLRIRANGRGLCEPSFERSRGWRTFHCDTSGRAGEMVRLEFVVTSNQVDRRHFVFRAWTVDGGAPRHEDVEEAEDDGAAAVESAPETEERYEEGTATEGE